MATIVSEGAKHNRRSEQITSVSHRNRIKDLGGDTGAKEKKWCPQKYTGESVSRTFTIRDGTSIESKLIRELVTFCKAKDMQLIIFMSCIISSHRR